MDNLILVDSLNKINESLNEISKNINNLNKDKECDKLLKENIKQKEVIDRLNFIKNRKNQGASQENINKMAIEFVNSWLKEVSE